jgi:thioredoxin-related protein
LVHVTFVELLKGMKKSLLVLSFVLLRNGLFAQDSLLKIYDPTANAEKIIASAIQQAKAEHKHVLLEAGGNWCSWCIEFNRFVRADGAIDSLLKKCFVVYHLNYSLDNKNNEVFKKYGYPQRFGFPVFIILDANGNRIHTQNSEYLEQGKSYNKQKVFEFLLNWTPQALEAVLYK